MRQGHFSVNNLAPTISNATIAMHNFTNTIHNAFAALSPISERFIEFCLPPSGVERDWFLPLPVLDDSVCPLPTIDDRFDTNLLFAEGEIHPRMLVKPRPHEFAVFNTMPPQFQVTLRLNPHTNTTESAERPMPTVLDVCTSLAERLVLVAGTYPKTLLCEKCLRPQVVIAMTAELQSGRESHLSVNGASCSLCRTIRLPYRPTRIFPTYRPTSAFAEGTIPYPVLSTKLLGTGQDEQLLGILLNKLRGVFNAQWQFIQED